MKTTYRRLRNGQIIRVYPERPWNSKKERKQVLRQRRIERAARAELARLEEEEKSL